MRGLAALTVLFLAGIAAADIGPKPRTYAPGLEIRRGDLEGLNIEMSAEDVRLTLKATGDQRHEKLEVEVDFDMTNFGDEVEIEEGFPVGPINNMSEFRITVDGEPVDFELVDLNESKSVKDRRPRTEEESADYWYVWKARFAAKSKSRQRVHYVVDLHHRFYTNVNTSYILHTGAPWKNAIGKAKVTLRLDGMPADRVFALSPTQGLKRTGDVWEWNFENLEPTPENDIRIRYDCENSWESEVAELRAKGKEFLGARFRLCTRLFESASRMGRSTMSGAELQDICDALQACLEGVSRSEDSWTVPIEPSAKHPTTAYSWGEFLFESYPDIVRLAEAHAESARARETLRAWQPLAEALAAGKLGTGQEPVKVQSYIEKKLGAEFQSARERARKLDAPK